MICASYVCCWCLLLNSCIIFPCIAEIGELCVCQWQRMPASCIDLPKLPPMDLVACHRFAIISATLGFLGAKNENTNLLLFYFYSSVLMTAGLILFSIGAVAFKVRAAAVLSQLVIHTCCV